MKRYAELIGNYKSQRIKNFWDNKLVIDSDYRGPCIAAVHNDSNTAQVIHDGDRICQLVVMPYIVSTLTEVEELNTTARNTGGFGSTGSF